MGEIMSTRNLTLRLDPELHDALREVSAAIDSTMVDLVRDALRDYLPRVADRRAGEMEGRLARLRAIAGDRGAMASAIQATAEAEAENPDPLEEEAVVDDGQCEDRTPLTTSVRKSFG
jgi:predicted transcriptional regulator